MSDTFGLAFRMNGSVMTRYDAAEEAKEAGKTAVPFSPEKAVEMLDEIAWLASSGEGDTVSKSRVRCILSGCGAKGGRVHSCRYYR